MALLWYVLVLFSFFYHFKTRALPSPPRAQPNDIQTMRYILIASAGKECKALVYNKNTKKTREIKVTPSHDPSNPLGAEIEFMAYEGHGHSHAHGSAHGHSH